MRRMKNGFTLLITLPLLIMAAAQARGEARYTVAMVVGDVKIVTAGKTSAAAPDMPLSGGETILTGRGAMADISFGDSGLVRVQERSKVAVAMLAKHADDADLDLSAGSVLVMLAKLVKGETYQVRTNTQVASVRGTSFRVSAEGDRSRVDVLTGEIMVHPVADGAVRRDLREYIKEGHSITLNRGAVREILAKRRKMAVTALRERDLEGLEDRFEKLRDSRGFKRLNKNLRGEFEARIKQIKKRRADRNIGRKQVRKHKIRQRIRQRRAAAH